MGHIETHDSAIRWTTIKMQTDDWETSPCEWRRNWHHDVEPTSATNKSPTNVLSPFQYIPLLTRCRLPCGPASGRRRWRHWRRLPCRLPAGLARTACECPTDSGRYAGRRRASLSPRKTSSTWRGRRCDDCRGSCTICRSRRPTPDRTLPRDRSGTGANIMAWTLLLDSIVLKRMYFSQLSESDLCSDGKLLQASRSLRRAYCRNTENHSRPDEVSVKPAKACHPTSKQRKTLWKVNKIGANMWLSSYIEGPQVWPNAFFWKFYSPSSPRKVHNVGPYIIVMLK